MYGINDLMFVFYWRNSKEDEWSISQPVTIGEIIDGVEFEFNDGESLPINDVDWGNDELKVVPVPTRKYAPVSDLATTDPPNVTEASESAQSVDRSEDKA